MSLEQLTEQELLEKLQTTTGEERKPYEEQYQALLAAKAQQEEQQTIIDSVSAEDSSYSITAGGYTADFRALAAGETEYQILAITTQLCIAAIKDSYEAQITQLNANYTTLESELTQTQAELADVRSKLEAASNEITNLKLERDTAVSENVTLENQLNELRNQTTSATVTTNLDGSAKLAELNAKLEAAKIPVYDVQAGDSKTSYYTAKLAETGEEIEIRPYYLLKSKYREVTAEEAATFRAQVESEKAAALESVPEIVEPVVEAPPITFPNTEDTTDGLAGDSSLSENASDVGTGTTETFEESVLRRLEALETQVFGDKQGVAA